MGRGTGRRASRERAPVSAYRVLALGVAASLAFRYKATAIGQAIAKRQQVEKALSGQAPSGQKLSGQAGEGKT